MEGQMTTKRNWIKIYVDQSLRGTMISELSAAERWAWIGILLMGGDSNIDGKIFLRKDADRNLIGFSDPTLAELLGLTIDQLISAKEKMVEFKKIAVDGRGVISILNWNKYQSEYGRQKKYRGDDSGYKRDCNLGSNKTHALDLDLDLELDRDLELDKDKDKEKEKDQEKKRNVPNQIDIDLTQLLINKILENDIRSSSCRKMTEENQRTWIDDCRKLREIDERTPAEIRAIIEWCQNDNFWKANILSMGTLRKKFDRLFLQAKRDTGEDDLSGIRAWLKEQGAIK